MHDRGPVITLPRPLVALAVAGLLVCVALIAMDWSDPAHGQSAPEITRATDLDRFERHELLRQESTAARGPAAVRVPGVGFIPPPGARSCLFKSWSDRTLTCYTMDLSAHPFDGRLKSNAELNAEVLRRYGPLHVGGGNLLGIDAETLYNLGSQDLTRRCRADDFGTARTHDCFPTFEELYDFAAILPFWRPTPLEPTPAPTPRPTATPAPTATPLPSPPPTPTATPCLPAVNCGDATATVTPPIDGAAIRARIVAVRRSSPSGVKPAITYALSLSDDQLSELLSRALAMARCWSGGEPGPSDPATVPADEIKAWLVDHLPGPLRTIAAQVPAEDLRWAYVRAVRLKRGLPAGRATP